MKKIINRFIRMSVAFGISLTCLSSCGLRIPNKDSSQINSNLSSNKIVVSSSDEKEEFSKQKEIYMLAKASGFSGTYEEWLDSIKGDEIELIVEDNAIKWKYSTSTNWIVLVSLDDIKGQQGLQGPQGDPGKPGEDGLSVRTGEGTPLNSLGKTGDSYIDILTWDFYVKESEGWIKKGNISNVNSPEMTYEGTKGLKFYDLNDSECAVVAGDAVYEEKIIIPSVYNGKKVVKIKDYGFQFCSNLKTIVVPSNMLDIGYNAFYNCNGITEVINFSKLDIVSFSAEHGGIATNAYVYPTDDYDSLEYKNLVLKYAADKIWNKYSYLDDSIFNIAINFDNSVDINGKMVEVQWDLENENDTNIAYTEVIEDYTKLDADLSGFYFNNSFKISASLSYGGIVKTLSKIFENEPNKHSIDFKTEQLIINTHAEWDAAEEGEVLNIMGTVIDVCSEEYHSSLYLIDNEGNGYYIYRPVSKGAKQGDVIVVSGEKTIYNGQEEIKNNVIYYVVGENDITTIPVVDATEDWKTATSDKVTGELANKYQNIPVKLKECIPVSVSERYCYFTVGDGETVYGIYDAPYFLNSDQQSAWKKIFIDALENGYTLTIEGICTVYANSYNIYPSSLFPHFVTKEA